MANKTLLLCAGLLLALGVGLVTAADYASPTPQIPAVQSAVMMDPVWMNRLELAYTRGSMREIGRLVTEMKVKRAQAAMKGESTARPAAPARVPAKPAGVEARSALTSTPLGKNEEEKKILAVLDIMDKSQRPGMMNVPKEDGRLLRLLVAAVDAKNVVEIGTSNGYSGIWMCLGLRNTGGKLTTFEINTDRAEMARTNFELAGVADMVTLVEGDAHEKVADLKEAIDVLFLDADKEGYIDYLNKLLPLVRAGGLVLTHNMTPRMADPRYVTAVTENPELETLFINGMGVTLKKR